MSSTGKVNHYKQKEEKKSYGKIIAVSIIGVALVSIVAFFFVTLSKTGRDEILSGVTVEGVDISGMSEKDASGVLENELHGVFANEQVKVTFKDKELLINKDDIVKSFDIDTSAQAAYNIGREGSVFKRFFEILDVQFGGKDLNASFELSTKKIKKIVKPFVKDINDDVVNFNYEVDYDAGKLTLYSGKKIEGVDLKASLESVESTVVEHKSEVELEGVTIEPKAISYEKLLKKVSSSGKNATIKVLEGGKDFEYVESVDKIDVDTDELKAAYDSLVGTDDKTVILDVIAESADITLDNLKKKMFKDKLATYTTTFSTSSTTSMNRRTNMQLASKSINDYILAPGDVFSFNDICGPRNESTGYKIAGAYRDGMSTQEYGGGICQCSTTLYNAVLRADMEVIYRKNHTFDVPYAPKGLDATVSHPEVDFKWKNNYNYPVKVKASVASNSITVSLYGTIEDNSKEVIISSEILETRPMKTTYKYSPSYPKEGVQLSSGHNGYIARSYKTIKRNGKVESKTTIATSYYSMMNRVVGKKKVAKVEKQDKKEGKEKKKD